VTPLARSHQLTIFLLKPEVATAEAALDGPESLTGHAVAKGSLDLGQLFVRPQTDTPPRWTRLFVGSVDLSGLKSMSTAAVMVTSAGGRLFAVAFGYGRHLLRPGTWEERFGLKTTLNSIRPNSIRSIDRKTFDALSRHTHEQASREANATEFGLNIEQDLLRAVTGIPSDPTLGARMAGADALTVNIRMKLEDLPGLLERLLEASQGTGYREAFPWVDHIAEVTDASLTPDLDGLVVDAIRSGGSDSLWLVVPDVLDWQDVGGFRYRTSKKTDPLPDIHLSSFLETVDDRALVDLATLKQRKVHCFNPDDTFVIRQWRVYDCIYYEVDHLGARFLLTGGKWYRIAPDYVAEVNEAVAAIPNCDLHWPEYDDGSETEYNARVASGAPGTLALMDRVNIPYGGGHSTFEFCDLYTRDRQLVHVKRYGAASALSHLFAQGATAAELFYMEPSFRVAVNERLPDSHKISDPDARPEPQSYEVVFAIISRSADKLVLPFFSRINLRAAARRIRGFAYRVSLLKIGTTT